jgi:hypothetical protein
LSVPFSASASASRKMAGMSAWIELALKLAVEAAKKKK